MKTRNWRDYILLDDAGDLSPRKQRALERALAADPELRGFRDRLHQARRTVRSTNDETTVSDFTIERIKAEASRAPVRRESVGRTVVRDDFFAHWRPAMVYASASIALLLFASVIFIHYTGQDTPPHAASPASDETPVMLAEPLDVQFEEQLLELEQALDRLHSDFEEMAWMFDEDTEEDWAKELLQLEGS